MTEMQAFVAAGTATQSQRFVVGVGCRDHAQATGQWIACVDPVEVRP